MLYLFKGATAPFAVSVPLTGRANGNARRVGRLFVPSEPCGIGLWREAQSADLVFMVINHQGVHAGQGAQGRAQFDPVRAGAGLTPIIDGGFDIGDVDALHGSCIIVACVQLV